MTFRDVRNTIYPVAGISAILLIWQLYTHFLGINRIVLPSPLDILWASITNWDVLLRESWPTFLESVLGFALAVAIGIPFAVCVANSRVLNLTLYPILIATQSIPKVAIAPIILVWFGLGMQSKLVIAFLVAFFPIVVATMAGLRSTPPEMLRLCHALTSTKWQLFILVRLPFAVPYIFSGMKIAVTFAMIGVIIGEFITAQRGLGFIIIFASSQADTALILVAIAMLCVVGLGLYGAVALLERMVARIYGSA